MSQELVTVNSTPAQIAVNFAEVRERLVTELAKYDVVVTKDTLADAKKLAVDLNKNAGEFDARRKAAIESVSAPIKIFDGQMKELVGLCRAGRQKILDQVKVFEDEVRYAAEEKLSETLEKLWLDSGVSQEFQLAKYDDLIKLGSLTAKGNLSASAVSELKARVSKDANLQIQTDMRLIQLEAESYKAGLAAPLSKNHVAAFLMAPEEQYQQSLRMVISAEIERQAVAEDRIREKAEAEARRNVEATKAVAEPEPEQEPVPAKKQEPLGDSFAFGPLLDPRSASIDTLAPDAAFNRAAELSKTIYPSEPVGVWVPAGLIAIAFNGEVFKK